MSPRGALRLRLGREADRVAARIADTILDPEVSGVVASRLALEAIEAVDPQAELTATVSMPDTIEGVDALTPAALLTLAARMGLEPSPLPALGAEPA